MQTVVALDSKYQVVEEQDIGMFQTATGNYIVKTVVLKLLRKQEQEAKKP